MATTDANGILFYETTDSISPLQVLLNAGQQSVSDALNGRARIYKTVAASPPGTSAAGDIWYQTDTKTIAVSDGTYWYGAGGTFIETTSTATLGPGTAGLPLSLATVCFLDVTAGRWEITAGGSLRNPGAADAAAIGLINVTTSTEVTGGRGTSQVTSAPGTWSLESYPMIVTVTATTRFAPIMYPAGSSTLSFSADAGGKSAWIRARRI